MEKPKDLKVKKVPGRIKVWKITPYKDSKIYLRTIGEDIFEYLVVWHGEIYSDYMIFTPEEGKKKLTEGQTHQALGMVLAGACATVDSLRGETPTEDEASQAQAILDVFNPENMPKEKTAKLPN